MNDGFTRGDHLIFNSSLNIWQIMHTHQNTAERTITGHTTKFTGMDVKLVG